MKRAALGFGLVLFVLLGAPAAAERAVYEVRLEAEQPLLAEVTLTLAEPRRRPVALYPARKDRSPRITPPRCGGKRLAPLAETGWRVPPDCRRVTWSARLAVHGAREVSARQPVSFWHRRRGYWLITEGASLLRVGSERSEAEVVLKAELGDGETRSTRHRFPTASEAPYYGVLALRPRETVADGPVSLRVLGPSPETGGSRALERLYLEIWRHWRKRLLPRDWRGKVEHIDIVWIPPGPGEPAGVTGSVGSQAVLLQVAGRGDDPRATARRRTALLMAGAHEIFHSIVGPQDWPQWASESLANHFALRAVEPYLEPGQAEFLHATFLPDEAGPPLLQAQKAYSGGDRSKAFVFYSKGARFWRALEDALVETGETDGQTEGGGALAPIFKKSGGFAGLDLTDPEALAAFFDDDTDGRASALVRRYLAGKEAGAGQAED